MNSIRRAGPRGPFIAGVMGLTTMGALIGASRPASAQQCNSLTVQTATAPSKSATVYVSVESFCRGVDAGANICGVQSFAVTSTTTIQQKCELIAQAVDQCQVQWGIGVHVDGGVDQCDAGLPILKAIDTQCPTTGGLVLGLSNDQHICNEETGFPLPDYERDFITPSCAGLEQANQVAIQGSANTSPPFTASGQPIFGSPASVLVELNLTPIGGSLVTASVNTSAGEKPSDIASALVAQLNLALTNGSTFSGGVTCAAVGQPASGIRCTQPTTTSTPVAMAVQLNDTGLESCNFGGPVAGMPPVQCPDCQTTHVAAPATPPWALVLLAGLLGGLGIVFFRLRANGRTA